MKRFLSLILIFALLLCFSSCKGNYSPVDLKDSMEIPENGIIEEKILAEIKNDNAIAVFTGKSNGINYEWTIFGSDITEAKSINLNVDLTEEDDGIGVEFSQKEDFGFPVLLSLYLNEKWETQSASVYKDNEVIYSVSITGSKTSILNISISKIVDNCIIKADKAIYEEVETEAVVENKDTEVADNKVSGNDAYLSNSGSSDNRVYSDGSSTNQDEYKTDPVPEGKPLPTEPEDQTVDKAKSYTCTFSIECSTILNNLADLDPDKLELVPSNGVILAPTKVTFYEGESVYDVLQRVCKDNNIHMESSWTPIYNSAYVEGIHNLYEFDCGELSGWMYRVNGWYPNYGCSRYVLVDGEVVEWRYTCDLGKDVGCDWMA